MKAILVGDNRDVENWGCRSTSKALRDIISQRIEIVNVVSRIECHTPVPLIYGKLPGKIASFVERNRDISPFRMLYDFHIKEKYNDFVSLDIEWTLKQFLRNKETNPYFKSLLERLSEVDALIINGEGTFIFSIPSRRDTLFFLFLIRLAIHLGKNAFVLNAMISPCPKSGFNEDLFQKATDLFLQCKAITIRDPLSFDFLQLRYSGTNVTFIPDALFSWFQYFKNGVNLPQSGDYLIPFPDNDFYWHKISFEKPYIVLSGSSSAAWTQQKAIPIYSLLAEKMKRFGLQVIIVPTCSGDRFLYKVAAITSLPIVPLRTPIVMGAAVLAGARVMVSGRFHPSILASLGGTPCVFLGSNSHKNTGLQQILGYESIKEFSALPTEDEQEEILSKVADLLENNESNRKKIIKTVKQLAEDCFRVASAI